MLLNVEEVVNPDEVDFELFCRLVAVYLELANNPKLFGSTETPAKSEQQSGIHNDEEEEYYEDDDA